MARPSRPSARDAVPSSVASSMAPSIIRELMDAAWERGDAIRLEVGQPDFSTPVHVVEAADRAARDGVVGYAPNAGIPELRDALADKLRRVNGTDATAGQVVVTTGGMGAIFTSLRVLADVGDEVLLPDPGWPNFEMAAGLLGLRVVRYRLDPARGHQPDPAELEALVTDRTAVIVTVSPSNPLGVVLSEDSIHGLVELVERRGLWLLCDQVYDELTFDGPPRTVAAVAPSPRIVTIHSFSKVYAMCGWRVGYAVAPVAVARRLTEVQEAVTSSVNLPAQHAALAALEGPQAVVAEMRDAYRARRDLVLDGLRAAGVPAVRPAGAFYVWADVSAAGLGSHAFSHELLREGGVAVAPGIAFGATGDHAVRLSLASSDADLAEGVRRLGAFVGARVGR